MGSQACAGFAQTAFINPPPKKKFIVVHNIKLLLLVFTFVHILLFNLGKMFFFKCIYIILTREEIVIDDVEWRKA